MLTKTLITNTAANTESFAVQEGNQAAKAIALRHLTRREYSRYELRQKLRQNSVADNVIESVLDELIQAAYQSDKRFAENYIRSRINAGDGPFKIKIKLREKGICDSLTLAILDTLNIDWHVKAQKAKTKRFGNQLPPEAAELSKQIRYLKSKGFYREHIHAAFAKAEQL